MSNSTAEEPKVRYRVIAHSFGDPETYTFVDTLTGERLTAPIRDLVRDKDFVGGLSPEDANGLGWSAGQEWDRTNRYLCRWMSREKLGSATVFDWEDAGRPMETLKDGEVVWSDTGEPVECPYGCGQKGALG
ncbi:MAG: hypothetical protein ACE5FN_09160 [Leptospirillia bacterium]